MSLTTRLAEELVCSHPERAAAVLERAPVPAVVRVLSKHSADRSAAVLRCMSPASVARVLEAAGSEVAARLIAELALDEAARVLRVLSDDLQSKVVEQLSEDQAGAVRALLSFPPNTAGALMDPRIVALPQDLSAREALARIRDDPEHTRYNVYVVDRQQQLVGVLNLRELLLAKGQEALSDLMVREPARLEATAAESTILGHTGWKEVHALPVVDANGRYLGALRYRVLRRLQEKHLAKSIDDSNTSEALGELFATGAAGMLDALTGGGSTRGGAK